MTSSRTTAASALRPEDIVLCVTKKYSLQKRIYMYFMKYYNSDLPILVNKKNPNKQYGSFGT